MLHARKCGHIWLCVTSSVTSNLSKRDFQLSLEKLVDQEPLSSGSTELRDSGDTKNSRGNKRFRKMENITYITFSGSTTITLLWSLFTPLIRQNAFSLKPSSGPSMKTLLPKSLQQFCVFLIQLVGILFTAYCTGNQRWLIGLGTCPGGALLGSALQVVMGFVLFGRR